MDVKEDKKKNRGKLRFPIVMIYTHRLDCECENPIYKLIIVEGKLDREGRPYKREDHKQSALSRVFRGTKWLSLNEEEINIVIPTSLTMFDDENIS